MNESTNQTRKHRMIYFGKKQIVPLITDLITHITGIKKATSLGDLFKLTNTTVSILTSINKFPDVLQYYYELIRDISLDIIYSISNNDKVKVFPSNLFEYNRYQRILQNIHQLTCLVKLDILFDDISIDTPDKFNLLDSFDKANQIRETYIKIINEIIEMYGAHTPDDHINKLDQLNLNFATDLLNQSNITESLDPYPAKPNKYTNLLNQKRMINTIGSQATDQDQEAGDDDDTPNQPPSNRINHYILRNGSIIKSKGISENDRMHINQIENMFQSNSTESEMGESSETVGSGESSQPAVGGNGHAQSQSQSQSQSQPQSQPQPHEKMRFNFAFRGGDGLDIKIDNQSESNSTHTQLPKLQSNIHKRPVKRNPLSDEQKQMIQDDHKVTEIKDQIESMLASIPECNDIITLNSLILYIYGLFESAHKYDKIILAHKDKLSELACRIIDAINKNPHTKYNIGDPEEKSASDELLFNMKQIVSLYGIPLDFQPMDVTNDEDFATELYAQQMGEFEQQNKQITKMVQNGQLPSPERRYGNRPARRYGYGYKGISNSSSDSDSDGSE